METSKASRVFTEDRRLQGFRSQEHLDAYYAYTDHFFSCGNGCNTPGPSVWSEADASWIPSLNECEEGKRLILESFSYLD